MEIRKSDDLFPPTSIVEAAYIGVLRQIVARSDDEQVFCRASATGGQAGCSGICAERRVIMLRAIETLSSYVVVSSDQRIIGSPRDLHFDVEHWAIRYLGTDSASRLAERKVLVSPMAVTTAEWKRRHIITNLPLERIRHAPLVN